MKAASVAGTKNQLQNNEAPEQIARRGVALANKTP